MVLYCPQMQFVWGKEWGASTIGVTCVCGKTSLQIRNNCEVISCELFVFLTVFSNYHEYAVGKVQHYYIDFL